VNTLKFAILIDNSAHTPGLATEHGLSIWIDTGETRILFDTGQSNAFFRNAQALEIDVSAADHLVLSHGHYDHTGGLAALEGVLRPGTPIHAHPGILPKRYSRHADGTVHEIGLPDSAREFLARREACFHPVTAPTEIAPRMWLTGPVPRETAFEDTGGDFWLDKQCSQPDPIEDDLSLWVERDEGLWIFLGCAHAGVANIIRHIQTVSGRKDVHAVIGGTHLRSASPERLEKTAAFFRELAPAVLLPCHCSGDGINDLLRMRKTSVWKAI
jgi:7,8-dihydropterin-6-yl-methyl-4-(beta-D-ribofuranosyl)aminobenzene 5'-phosphate synthase